MLAEQLGLRAWFRLRSIVSLLLWPDAHALMLCVESGSKPSGSRATKARNETKECHHDNTTILADRRRSLSPRRDAAAVMDLGQIQSVCQHDGPFVTVYLERRSASEDAVQQIHLRWADLREQLSNAGAPSSVLQYIDDDLSGPKLTEIQADGRVLIATADAGVLLNAPWDAALDNGDAAYWTNSPQLGAYVRAEAGSVRLLVAIVDQNGARVRQEIVASRYRTNVQDEETVSGSGGGAHKPREGALAHNRIQRHADENVKRNAQDIAEQLSQMARDFGPDIVVLAGETQGRDAVRGQLPKHLAQTCVETGRGGTDDDAAEQVLADELRRIAAEESTRHMREQAEHFDQAHAHGLAADGVQAVALAAEMAAVDTLLLHPERSADNEADVIAACARGDAHATLTDTDVTDHMAAILRFAIDMTHDDIATKENNDSTR